MRITDPPDMWMQLETKQAKILCRVAASFGLKVWTRDDLDQVKLLVDDDDGHMDLENGGMVYPELPRDIVVEPGCVFVFAGKLGDMTEVWDLVDEEMKQTVT